MVPLKKLEKLRDWGYDVVMKGRDVELYFTTPTIGEAASSPEVGSERRCIVVKGVVEGDVVRLTEAYVEEEGGARRRIDLRDLELWIWYV